MKLSLIEGERALMAISALLSDGSSVTGIAMRDVVRLVRAGKALDVFQEALKEVRKRLAVEDAAETLEDGQVILTPAGVEKYRAALAEQIEVALDPLPESTLEGVDVPVQIARDLAALYL